MAQHNSDTIFHIVNYNIHNVLQSGIAEIEKFRRDKSSMCDRRSFIFMRHITFFVDHATDRIRLSATSEEKRQLYYRKLWHENNEMRKKISVLSKILERQRNTRGQIEKKINIQHINNMKLLKRIAKKCAEDAKLISKKFEFMQINEYKQSIGRKNDLNQICNIAENKTQNLLMAHELSEKDIYSKRYKVRSQYVSLINRYDTEIGERQKIIANLKSEFDKLNKERHQLEDTIEKQLIIYESCIDAIRLEKIKEFTDRIKLSKSKDAIKKIEQWWQLIIDKRKINKMKKSNGKKKKKKKRRKISP